MSKLKVVHGPSVAGMAILVSSLVGLAGIAHADGFGNDNVACAADRPCFNGVYQSGNKVIFQFTGVTGWEFYNVRYVHDGREKQVENRSGTFTFTDAQPNRVYKLSVQGCDSHTLARSTCSPWVEESFTTQDPSRPAAPQPRGTPSGKTLGRVPMSTPAQPPGKTLGRVPVSTPDRQPPICERAQAARARNSPAAPDLEAQCLAAGGRDVYYRLQVKHSGKYLDAVNCSDQVALNAGSTYAAGACQLWRFVPAGDGWNRLQLKQGSKYLDASYCSEKVALNGNSSYAAGACQLWRFVPVGDGWNRLQVKHSGKYLDASYCSDNVVLNGNSSYANGDCQLWRLTEAAPGQ
jgi:hypothetical protein